MWLQIASMIGTHLLVPLAFLTLAGRKAADKLTSLAWLLLSAFYIAYLYLAGRWDWLGYPLRYVLPAGVLIAVVPAVRHQRRAPFLPKRSWKAWGNIALTFLLSVVFLFIALAAWIGRDYEEEAVALAFPLREGRYYVGHGGNSPVVNYHNTYAPQRYALDIVKLNAWGYRASGWYPDDLERYAIYGDRLYSPCAGIVRKAVDGYPDRRPSDYANGLPEGTPAAGNHVVIACGGADVYIAHMQQGSVRVQEGDAVDEQTWIGNVGNSGNTSEPHLHIHAERDGVGVPITFDGRFLLRNHVVHYAAAAE
jgi:hypothetical protein